MGVLITPTTYQLARAALDLSLDATSLPAETIDLFTTEAEELVLTLDPAAATYGLAGGDLVKQARAERATAYLIAAALARQLPAIMSEQLGDLRYSRQAYDGAAAYARLRGLGLALIDLNTGLTGATTPLFSFTTAPGYRGR